MTTLIHRLGAGISQGIGTGGRDLHEAVGGLATLQVLSWLARDPETHVIGLVSKAPSGAVARRVLEAAGATGKPVVAYLPGWSGKVPASVLSAATLEATALACVSRLRERLPGANIRTFAMIRTMTNPSEFRGMLDPCTGTIRLSGDGSTTRAP